eukprot:6682763-Prymnesium_polylepis.1
MQLSEHVLLWSALHGVRALPRAFSLSRSALRLSRLRHLCDAPQPGLCSMHSGRPPAYGRATA